MSSNNPSTITRKSSSARCPSRFPSLSVASVRTWESLIHDYFGKTLKGTFQVSG
jgi:hypothetical protein